MSLRRINGRLKQIKAARPSGEPGPPKFNLFIRTLSDAELNALVDLAEDGAPDPEALASATTKFNVRYGDL